MNILGFIKKIPGFFKEIWFLWALCLIVNIITFLAVFFKVHSGNTNYALHYNILIGVDWRNRGANLYFVPVIGLTLGVINLFVYRRLKDGDNFLSFLTAFISLVIQVILLAAVLFLSIVN